jgi:hypothetical protein
MKFILDIKINGLVQKGDIAAKIYYTAGTKKNSFRKRISYTGWIREDNLKK